MKIAAYALLLAGAATLAGCNQTSGPALEELPLTLMSNDGSSGMPVSAAASTAATARAAIPAGSFVAPQWSVGDTWTYSDGYAFQAVEVNGDKGKFKRLDDGKQWFAARGPFREASQSSTALRQVVFRSADPSQLYGAKPGQSVVFIREYTKNGKMIRHRTSWTLEGKEVVNVPAGTFEAYVLVMRTRSLTGNWTGYERWWYSPAVKNYVRMEFKYGEAPESARVLTNYSVK